MKNIILLVLSLILLNSALNSTATFADYQDKDDIYFYQPEKQELAKQLFLSIKEAIEKVGKEIVHMRAGASAGMYHFQCERGNSVQCHFNLGNDRFTLNDPEITNNLLSLMKKAGFNLSDIKNPIPAVECIIMFKDPKPAEFSCSIGKGVIVR